MKLILMGAGDLGMALLQFLQQGSDEIYVTTTDPNKVATLRNYATDVLLLHPDDNTALRDLIDTRDAMVIIGARKGSQSYEETYLNTAKRIAKSLQHRTKPFHIIYTSSTSVYEGTESEWATEDLPLNPTAENSKILLATEELLLKSANTCILRLGGIHGPKRELESRAHYFSDKELPGSGNKPINHSHLKLCIFPV